MKAATAKARTRFQNILFATDFSPAAAHAIPFIKKIARHFESSLVALHVKPPVVNPMTQPGTWPVDLEVAKVFDKEHREELLDTFAEIKTEVLMLVNVRKNGTVFHHAAAMNRMFSVSKAISGRFLIKTPAPFWYSSVNSRQQWPHSQKCCTEWVLGACTPAAWCLGNRKNIPCP